MVVFRFGVILTPECSDIEVLVSGSRPEMGHWDPSRSLLSAGEPGLWIGHVRLSEPHTDKLWFKFIKRVDGNYIWEGTVFREGIHCTHLSHSVERHQEAFGHLRHTGKIYTCHRLRHPTKVLPHVCLGSCPQRVKHVTLKLKQELGVTAVMNFQTECDVINNSHVCRRDLSQPMSPLLLLDISTIVILSSAGRTQMLPQAVFLLYGLLENGHTVYFHCNAGVGRSTVAVCGLLMYVLDWRLRKMQYYLTARRAAVYIDEGALVRAENDFLSVLIFSSMRPLVASEEKLKAFLHPN
uniref:EPM2A glucan phosphatase, laforin n=1 Tax=Sinocyclocheilus anshuiensis TaxID=1608454 RepID=A0A671RKF5_9TELE